MPRLQLRIGAKLIATLATLVVCILVVALVGRAEISDVSGEADLMFDRNVQQLEAVSYAAAELDGAEEHALLTLMASGEERRGLEAEFGEIESAVGDQLGNLRQVFAADPKRLAEVDALEGHFANFAAAYKGGELSQGFASLSAGAEKVDAVMDPAKTVTDELTNDVERMASARHDAIGATQSRSEALVLGGTLLAILLGLGAGVLLVRNVVPRVRSYSAFAGQVAEGDLTARVEASGSDELADLGRSLNAMVDKLASMSGRVTEGATTIGSSTSEIMASVSQQTASVAQQSAAIQQISATVEEVRAASEQAARTAEDVALGAQESLRVSDEGAQAVQDIVGGMADISAKVDEIAHDILALSEQTQQISAITTTVNDLADQSNLLALNATIEAARAGEQGKGFAVVADQVRNLSEQSKEATNQVQKIIGDIQKATNAAVMNAGQGTTVVKAGAELAERAGEVISALAHSITEAEQSAQVIAASTQEQSAGMDQIAQAMAETKQATTQLVAGVEQTQGAMGGLSDLAGRLQELAGQYRTEEGAAAAGARS